MVKKAFLFPGQGAQRVGMGKDLYEEFPEARSAYESANEILGFDLAQICFNGPQDELTKTSVSQPAILVTSIAAFNAMRNRYLQKGNEIECQATAGLSLGEYTALVVAKALTFEDAVRLVHKRGIYMQEASEENIGGMASIIGLSDEQVEEICDETRQDGELVAANMNCPGQVAISGDTDAIKRACSLAEKRGAKMVVPLQVAGAFHSKLMNSAAKKLEKELASVTISRAKIPVVANVTANYVQEPKDIRESLIKQVCSPVLWHASMRRLIHDGFEEFYEIGTGKVLSGLMRRIDRTKRVKNIDSVKSLKI